MAAKKDKIIKTVTQFVDSVRSSGISVKQAYLFGSYANGKADRYSDIDVAIVSSQLKGNLVLDTEKLIEKGLLDNALIEVHPFRPENFKNSNPFVKEIKDTGIRIV